MKSIERINNYTKVLPILELYTAVQAEGSRTGIPTIVIRTTGCTCRCFFKEGGFCDSWQTSIHPEKGIYCFQDIIDIYDKNPHIKEMMITGGSPTMHPNIVNELTHFANERGIFTTIETEGSHMIATDFPIGLVSLSPKFSNSIPVLGVKTPLGKIVDQKMIDQHNKYRQNYAAMQEMINYHSDYQIKPVIDKDLKVIPEVLQFLETLSIPKEKVWMMPAGDNIETLLQSYGPVMNYVRDNGFRFTGRPHIIAFNRERYV